MRMLTRLFAIFASVFCVESVTEAKVDRLEIVERVPFAKGYRFGVSGAYERIIGRLHYAVDPKNSKANSLIVDLGLAPTDSRGLVGFSGDFMILYTFLMDPLTNDYRKVPGFPDFPDLLSSLRGRNSELRRS